MSLPTLIILNDSGNSSGNGNDKPTELNDTWVMLHYERESANPTVLLLRKHHV